MPALTQSIVATGTYYDAKISHPERLVLELITDGLAGKCRVRQPPTTRRWFRRPTAC